MNDNVRQQYATSGNLAKRGSFLGKYGTVNWFGWLIDRMTISENADVLDVGGGPAWLWRAQADQLPNGIQLTLVDKSAGMIEEAEANLTGPTDLVARSTFRVADAVALPFEDKSFDVVLLLHVLYHVDDRRTALEEAHRVLRPGGRVFVSTNAIDNMAELHEIGARSYGGEAVDPGAAIFSLDRAVDEMDALFDDVHRHDLTDVMTCTDPDDATAVLLSMPPGNASTPDQRQRLAQHIREETNRGEGTLRVTRRTGLVEGTKMAG